jgi:hypothetical protein
VILLIRLDGLGYFHAVPPYFWWVNKNLTLPDTFS